MDEARVKAFRALKPPCVELSQVALRYKGKKATGNDLIKALEDLQETLRAASKQANALDSKLAEYAFFPLSYIFRDTKDLPVRATMPTDSSSSRLAGPTVARFRQAAAHTIELSGWR